MIQANCSNLYVLQIFVNPYFSGISIGPIVFASTHPTNFRLDRDLVFEEAISFNCSLFCAYIRALIELCVLENCLLEIQTDLIHHNIHLQKLRHNLEAIKDTWFDSI